MGTGRSWAPRTAAAVIVACGLVGIVAAWLFLRGREGPAGRGHDPAATGGGGERAVEDTARRASPPQFVPPADRALLLAPTDPGYDPTKLLRVLPVREVFSQEPRVEAWAKAVEKFLGESIARDLAHLPGPPKVAVECRATMCRFAWTGAEEDHPKISRLIRFLYIGSGSGSGYAENEWIVMYKGGWLDRVDVSDPGALSRQLAEHRQKQLRAARARAQRGRPIRGLDSGVLPPERS